MFTLSRICPGRYLAERVALMISAAILSTYRIVPTNGPIGPLDLEFPDSILRFVISWVQLWVAYLNISQATKQRSMQVYSTSINILVLLTLRLCNKYESALSSSSIHHR
jgi:hypothetical protein